MLPAPERVLSEEEGADIGSRKNYDRRKPVPHPNPSEDLAEFFGIFLGDGTFNNKYQIAISFNRKCEQEHAKHVESLVYKLFGLRSSIRVREKYGSAEVIVSSSNLVDYLRNELNLPSISKKSTIFFPKWIESSIKYKIGFARGFFDSEGCVYNHSYISNKKRYSYIKIAVTNYNDELLVYFQNCLENAGIKSVKYDKRVHIYNETDAIRFFKVIGSNNPKNRKRFKDFLLSGEVA